MRRRQRCGSGGRRQTRRISADEGRRGVAEPIAGRRPLSVVVGLPQQSDDATAAAGAAPKVRRDADRSPDDGHVERQHDDERKRRVAGKLDVVERHVHEPVVWHRHTLRRKLIIVMNEVDRRNPSCPDHQGQPEAHRHVLEGVRYQEYSVWIISTIKTSRG